MPSAIDPLADLSSMAERQLSGVALSRYRIESARLLKEAGESVARPILERYIDLWSKRGNL